MEILFTFDFFDSAIAFSAAAGLFDAVPFNEDALDILLCIKVGVAGVAVYQFVDDCTQIS